MYGVGSPQRIHSNCLHCPRTRHDTDTAIATSQQPPAGKFEDVRAIDVRTQYRHGSVDCPMSVASADIICSDVATFSHVKLCSLSIDSAKRRRLNKTTYMQARLPLSSVDQIE